MHSPKQLNIFEGWVIPQVEKFRANNTTRVILFDMKHTWHRTALSQYVLDKNILYVFDVFTQKIASNLGSVLKLQSERQQLTTS